MAVGKRRRVVQGKTSPSKRRAPENEPDPDTDIWGASEEENSEDSEAEEHVETAEEKRLRIAKAYLQQLQATGGDAVGDEAEEGGTDGVAGKLREQALEAIGQQQRKVADTLMIPDRSGNGPSGRLLRCHWQPVTAVALSADDSTAYSVCKQGQIAAIDVETGSWTTFKARKASEKRAAATATQNGPEWVKKGPRAAGKRALLAAAVSDDGNLLAVGGGDQLVHLFDARSHDIVQSFPGHRDAITGLAFRQGTHELFSCALDRTVKTWSMDDRMYIDTLFGHQAEVLSIDVLRAERALTTGHDHTCRVWKIPDESQLICRASSMALDCCRYVTGTEWLTGSSDGTLALWTQFKKKPVTAVHGAHAASAPAADPPAALSASSQDVHSWIQSVAACPNSDLAASGAGNGEICLWAVRSGTGGRPESLELLGSTAARGFVNGLQLASSGKFLVAALGQEPRLGRWGRTAQARNGVLVQQLDVRTL